MKKLIILGIGIVLFVTSFYLYTSLTSPKPVSPGEATTDPMNMAYSIGDETFVLVNGHVTKESAPGSASKTTVHIFGEPVYGDLTGDGVADAAVLLVSDTGGSGAFYYAVLAIKHGVTYSATNALFLGDRIAPQTIEIQNGEAVYNYAERKADEPMTMQPSIGRSLWVYYDKKTEEIGEHVQNFEGEADSRTMRLDMKTWAWVQSNYSDDMILVPQKKNTFTLTFLEGNKITITTDCNQAGGIFTLSPENHISFTNLFRTEMFCENSQEDIFIRDITAAEQFAFTSKGQLLITSSNKAFTMVFQ